MKSAPDSTPHVYSGSRIHRQIYRLESDLANGNIWYLSPNKDFKILYNAEEQGWRIVYMNQTKPFLMTEKDPQAFDKCPHDSSLTWKLVEDREFYKHTGGDISVECTQEDFDYYEQSNWDPNSNAYMYD